MNKTLYEDEHGIQYRVIGFKNDQYKMEVVNSPYPNISEGITEWMDELPDAVNNPQEEFEPIYNLNEI